MGREEQAEEKETLLSIFPDELTGKTKKTPTQSDIWKSAQLTDS